jgi:hypothetical protein
MDGVSGNWGILELHGDGAVAYCPGSGFFVSIRKIPAGRTAIDSCCRSFCVHAALLAAAFDRSSGRQQDYETSRDRCHWIYPRSGSWIVAVRGIRISADVGRGDHHGAARASVAALGAAAIARQWLAARYNAQASRICSISMFTRFAEMDA